MRLHDTVLRMRSLLIERDVELAPARANARAWYSGPGANATDAWDAFQAVAAELATDPIRAWGALQPVDESGFLFEARYVKGSPAYRHFDATPEHYSLSLKRQLGVGEYGDMMGLSLTIMVLPHHELRPLKEELFSDHRGGEIDLTTHVAITTAWIAQVEASPAFHIPMTRHTSDRFSFDVDAIG